jgi:hypothetical protein
MFFRYGGNIGILGREVLKMIMKKTILPIVLAGIWITISEFARNELLFKSFWVDHYKSLNLSFETLPLNGVFWMVWSFILAYVIYELLKHYSFVKTLLLAWLTAFIMMWITIYNLQVLPLRLLFAAVPLSLVEIVIAELIMNKFGIRS